jgi:hypothetical protein
MSKEQETNTPFKNWVEPFEPWTRAGKAWVAEAEKYQQAALENVTRTMDEGYRLAKEGMNSFVTFNGTLRKQCQSQMDRATDFIKSFIS